jgi:putative nucleotidyltransferase with HDIG domain
MNDSLSPLKTITDLPVLSPLVARIGRIVSNPDSSVDAIVEALRLDPMVSGKVLKLANSAYVGIPRTISSLKNAVVLLGQKRIHSCVLATTVLSAFKGGAQIPFSHYRYWKHATTAAMIAESIAKHLQRYGPVEAEEVFSSALLHDIGRMALGCRMGDVVARAETAASERGIPVYQAEEPGTSHTAAGAVLSDHWNFPDSLKAAISFHHAPAGLDRHKRLVSIVHLSDCMAHIIGATTWEGEQQPRPSDEAVAEVRLPAERLKVIAAEVLENEKKLESFINFLV